MGEPDGMLKYIPLLRDQPSSVFQTLAEDAMWNDGQTAVVLAGIPAC